MLAAGDQVRIVARRTPPEWDKIPGATYVVADISQPIAADVMRGAQAIVHCAAETAGRWDQHQRNSIDATEHVVRAGATAGVKRMIHVSSISVMAVPARGELLSEDTPFEANSRTGGPNAWGKIESERLAVARCGELGIDLRVVRPSALVDYRLFDPPGLLGRRLGNIFVAVGMPGHQLGVVDVVFSGQALAWIVRHFDEAPDVLNLFEPELPTKRELLARLRSTNPDLTIVWLYPLVLLPLSWVAFGLQKMLRPRSPALSIAKVFARLRYDTSRIRSLAPAIRSEFARASRNEDVVLPAPPSEEAFVATASAALQSA